MVRQAKHHHFHRLTSKHFAIEGSASIITLIIYKIKGLIQGNEQIKTLTLATNTDYALNHHLLTLSNYVI